jgi:cytochrome c peroxidase
LRSTETTPASQGPSGRWRDINRFKVPGLRGLASRPPFFHDGSAATLADAIAHHDRRFSIGLHPDERDALAAFLAAL